MFVDGQDLRAGKIPVIVSEGDTVTFVITIGGHDVSCKLVLRCERNGEIYVSIQRP